MHLINLGFKVAVIAIDPSSTRTGGSILGDKTRMQQLARHPGAFVRPSPTRGALGGIAEHTHDVVALCEAAGFNIVLVETVGLGQSEVAVDGVVDMLVLVAPPAGGDELQGVKKGIMEVADAVLVNKCDGSLLPAARQAAAEFRRALQLVRRKHDDWTPAVCKMSAMNSDGLDHVWQAMSKFWHTRATSRGLQQRRKEQATTAMLSAAASRLGHMFDDSAGVRAAAAEARSDLESGAITPRVAATRLLQVFLRECGNHPILDVAVRVSTSSKSEEPSR